MDEQINISALGIVCYSMWILKARALYGYTFRKMKIEAPAKINLC